MVSSGRVHMFVVIFVILIGIRFHDDMAAIKIFETTLESGERMLKFSFRFEYHKTTATTRVFTRGWQLFSCFRCWSAKSICAFAFRWRVVLTKRKCTAKQSHSDDDILTDQELKSYIIHHHLCQWMSPWRAGRKSVSSVIYSARADYLTSAILERRCPKKEKEGSDLSLAESYIRLGAKYFSGPWLFVGWSR